MASRWLPEGRLSIEDLHALERSYRRDLLDVAAARARCASLRHVADRDEQAILAALERIRLLLENTRGAAAARTPDPANC